MTAPVTKIDFDLDAEPDEPREPWRVQVGGKIVEFVDPQSLDWKDLMEIDDPIFFLRYSVSDEDRAHIKSLSMSGKKLGKLIEMYLAHFGIDLSKGKGKADSI